MELVKLAILALPMIFATIAFNTEPNQDEIAIRKVESGLEDAWNRHDMKAWTNFFTEDADLVNVVGWWWKGRAEIEKMHTDAHVLLLPSSEAQQGDNQFRVVNPAALTFEAGPNIPACAKFAVLRENPTNGASVTVAKWPAGCRVPKHWHTPNLELIMISGKMRLETEGNKMLQAGDYVFLPSRHHHEFPCATACVFYLISDGPFDIHYVDSDGKEIPAEQALRRPPKP